MRQATDTTLRYLALLQRLPQYPQRKSTRDLQAALADENTEFVVDIRTIQRDLDKLSAVYPISYERQGRINYWFWTDKAALTLIPTMSRPTALTFLLAADYLQPILPPSILALLEPYFQHAREMLKDTKLDRWRAQTRLIGKGPVLSTPKVNAAIQEAIYQALLELRQVEVVYRSRATRKSKRFRLHSQALVIRHGTIYLVATAWDYEEPLHFVLHRMIRAELTDEPARPLPGFDLKEHLVEEKEFAYPCSEEKIRLKVLFDKSAAFHLSESRLAADQTLTEQPDGRMLLTATVDDTSELRWWLLAFGDQVEVKAPKHLRQQFREIVDHLANIYS